MRSPSPDTAALLPIMALVLDQQLRTLEHAPRRRRAPSPAETQQRAKLLGDIVRGFAMLVDFGIGEPRPLSLEEADRQRADLMRRLDEALATYQREHPDGSGDPQ